MSTRAVIIGAGIGGLTCAIALQQAGLEVVVLERHPTARTAGTGLLLWGETLDVLDALGVGPAVVAGGSVIDRSELRDAQGRRFDGLWMGSFVGKDRGSRPPVCIHRAVLHEILLAAAGEDRLRCGASFQGFSLRDGRVRVEASGIAPVEGDALVGADGAHSSVRAMLFPEARARYGGQTMFRGVVPAMPDLHDGSAYVAIGDSCRFGWEPMGDGSLYWFGGRFQPDGVADHPAGHKADLLETFGDWAAPVPQLIRRTPDDQIMRNDVYLVGPLDRWSDGRATLLGDAAHSFAPHIGHGACLAIDDAAALAPLLGSEPVESALTRYERSRRAAVQPVFDKEAQMRAGLESGTLIPKG